MQRKFEHNAYADVQVIIDKMQRDGDVSVLEAGCGSHGWFDLPEKTHLAGIDIAPEQLERNKFLQDKILGDLQQYALPKSAYDMIFCCDVLEHLEHPELALRNMAESMKPGAILVLTAPIRESLKGTITRLTPHWFHVFVYKHLLRYPGAGDPGRAPFPTYLRKAMCRDSIARFAQEHGMSVEFVATYNSGMYARIKKTSAAVYYLIMASGAVVKLVTLGAIRADITDFSMVLRKGGPVPAAEISYARSHAAGVQAIPSA